MITTGDSSNLVKIADNLKGLTDNALEREKQNPHGFAPAYMIVSEQGRRQNLRKKYPGDPQTTVAQDLSMASQSYQGKDVLSGILGGNSSSYFSPRLAGAEGGIVGYNEGGVVNSSGIPGYFLGGMTGYFPGNASLQKMVDDMRPKSKEEEEELLARQQANRKTIDEKAGIDRNSPGLFDRIVSGIKSLGETDDKKDETPVVKNKPSVVKTNPNDKYKLLYENLKNENNQKKEPSAITKLLEDEYKLNKQAYDDFKNKEDMSKQLALMGFGLNLAQTGNLAKAGIAGIDKFTGEKDRQRKILSGLKKDRSASAKGLALSQLEQEKLGINRRDLQRKLKKDARDLELKIKTAANDEEKNKLRLAGDLIKAKPQLELQQAINQVFGMYGSGGNRGVIGLGDVNAALGKG